MTQAFGIKAYLTTMESVSWPNQYWSSFKVFLAEGDNGISRVVLLGLESAIVLLQVKSFNH